MHLARYIHPPFLASDKDHTIGKCCFQLGVLRVWVPADTVFPGNRDLGTSVGPLCLAWMANPLSNSVRLGTGESEQVFLWLGGSQKVLWATSLRLGGARRAPDSRLFAQILFQPPPPRLHLLCSHHPGQLAAVIA